jgi:hypothetical protein
MVTNLIPVVRLPVIVRRADSVAALPAPTTPAHTRSTRSVRPPRHRRVREQRHTWLAGQAQIVGPGGQLLVKNPRTFWALDLWSEIADDIGIDRSYLTMLRHPAEVVQSRDINHLTDRTDEFRRTRQTANLANWVNSAYEAEVATRPRPRAFVRFTDLLTDWRATLRQVQEQFGISYNADLSTSEPHEVDDFIDVGLRRNRVDWDGIETLPELRDQATLAWEACNALVDGPYDEKAVRTLDEVHDRYVVLHQFLEAIALDHSNISVVRERRSVTERTLEELRDLRERLAQKQKQVKRLRAELARPADQGRRLRLPWRG